MVSHLGTAIESVGLRPLHLGLVLILPLFFGCGEPLIVISVDEKVPLRFSFTGNSTVPFFVVLEIGDQDKEGRTKYTTLWKIIPDSTKAATVPFGPITYGIVPTGWTQAEPHGSPPPLVEGRFYHAGGPAISMPAGVVVFKIEGGRVVRIR